MVNTTHFPLPKMDEAANNSVNYNEALPVVDALLTRAVEDSILTAPPGSPGDGLLWAVPAAPSGAWAGQAGKLALLTGGGWIFLTPVSDVVFRDKTNDIDVISDGSNWSELVVSGGGGGSSGLGSPPVVADFTEFNGRADVLLVDVAAGGISVLNVQPDALTNITLWGVPITAGADFDIKVALNFLCFDDTHWSGGLALYDSVSGQHISFGANHSESVELIKYPELSTSSGSSIVWGKGTIDMPKYFRLKRVGAVLTAYISLEGEHWSEVDTLAMPADISDVTHIGLSIYRENTNTPGQVHCSEWSLT